ncbi:MAG: hypothetical protein WCQ57_00855 [Verrucomicrobiota bacterium]
MKIVCPRLGDFDIGDRDAVRTAFADAPTLHMQQGWRDAPEEKFLPSRVRIGWRADRFLVFGELTDEHLFTQATEDNQILCSFGDVFEIFLRDSQGDSYAEFHVAPNGKRLQLMWPDAATIRRVGKKEVSLDELKVHEPIFDFSHWSEGKTWCICASVPCSVFLPVGMSLEGRIWLASFSRYDYSSAEEQPVLSSTSPHAELSFHRQQEWAEVFFAEA